MRKKWLLAGLGALVLAILALVTWAWIDGGREPLREIVVPVPLPAGAG